MSYKVVLTFESVDESVNIKLKQRSSNFLFTPSKVIRIPESVKFLLMESGILGFGIRNSTKNLNPANDWNL